jgi:hypothetical protein
MNAGEVAAPKLWTAAFYLSLAILAAVLVYQTFVHPVLESDTHRLLLGLPALRKCIQKGTWGNCKGASYFGLLQHIPAWIGFALSRNLPRTGFALCLFSLVSVFALAGTGFFLLRKTSRTVSQLWILLLGSSPLLYYCNHSFSEPLAALLNLLFVAFAATSNQGWLIFVVAFVAGLSKETTPLLLLPLLAVALVFRRRNDSRERILAAAASSVFGLLLSALANDWLNLVRYGTLSNAFYSQEALRVHDLGIAARFFAAAWASPSGGLLFFWPAFAMLLASLCAAAIFRRAFDPLLWLSLGALCVPCLALAFWHSPFGWICWGDRLLLPWIPAVVLLLLWTQHEQVESFFVHLGRLRLTKPLGAMIGIFSLPQLLVVFDNRWMMDVFRPAPGCKTTPKEDFVSYLPYYYQCLDQYLWRIDATVFRIFRALETKLALGFLALAFVLLFMAGLSSLPAPAPPQSKNQPPVPGSAC